MNPMACGVDETGRGPLAGPVYAAAVILGSRRITGLKDSKVLSQKQREELSLEIRERCAAWAIASASVEEIDTHNILRATLLAMRRAVEQLTAKPSEVLVDGLHCPQIGYPVRAIVKGDAKVRCISAASILAKVARDKEMQRLHERYPEYGFDQHKGYGTAFHLAALRRHGPSPVHRRSFSPVRNAYEAIHGRSQLPLI